MTRWRLPDGSTYSRKHFWLPCAVAEDLDGKTDAEIAAIYRAHRWMDLISNGEWPVLLQTVRNPSVKSRLKRKIVWWLMALGRIAEIQPELFSQAYAEARAQFEQQFGRPHPLWRPPADDDEAAR